MESESWKARIDPENMVLIEAGMPIFCSAWPIA